MFAVLLLGAPGGQSALAQANQSFMPEANSPRTGQNLASGNPFFPDGSDENYNKTILENIARSVEAKYSSMPRSVESKPVIAYIRGNAGIPLPTESDLMSRYKITPHMKEEIVDRLYEASQKIYAKMTHPVPAGTPSMETCIDSSVETIPINGMPRSDKVILDTLYLRREQVPTKPQEVFGSNVVIRSFLRDANDPLSLAIYAKKDQIGCLPFRMRVVAGTMYLSHGGPALKNYDSAPHGLGILHGSMERLVALEGW